MAIPQKIIKFLDGNKAKYEVIKHRTVYTAFDKAATLKVAPKIIGKTLVMKLDKNPVLVLIPANKNLDKQKLKKIAKAKNVDFIKEAWMKKNLKGIKIGAVPPFGNLWKVPTFIARGRRDMSTGMPVYIDRGLSQNPKIIINSGDYKFSIKISPTVLKKIIPDLVINNFSAAKK
jgi:Ala-tRNA(Pro) deacylase